MIISILDNIINPANILLINPISRYHDGNNYTGFYFEVILRDEIKIRLILNNYQFMIDLTFDINFIEHKVKTKDQISIIDNHIIEVLNKIRNAIINHFIASFNNNIYQDMIILEYDIKKPETKIKEPKTISELK